MKRLFPKAVRLVPLAALAAVFWADTTASFAQYWPNRPPPRLPYRAPGPYRPPYLPPPPRYQPPPQISRAGNSSVQVQILHVNTVKWPEGPLETVQGCLNNSMCNNLLQVAASYAGVPPQALRFAGYAAALFKHSGEESRFSYSAPPGFTLCRVDIRTTSIVPPQARDRRISAYRRAEVESASTPGPRGANWAAVDPGTMVMSPCCRFRRSWSAACDSAV